MSNGLDKATEFLSKEILVGESILNSMQEKLDNKTYTPSDIQWLINSHRQWLEISKIYICTPIWKIPEFYEEKVLENGSSAN